MNPDLLTSRSIVPARWTAIAVAVLGAITLAVVAHSQGTGPSEAQGVSTKSLGTIDLSSEIEGMSARQLRARLVTIEPGGHIALHSHKDRPTMEYVVQGQPVEIRNGIEIPHQPGDMVIATRDVSHWWENRGTTSVVLLPVDIFKP
ncbi:cupin domain-containing protein [Scleromatobacter humisilvae]|uniref:Cupin domain-containing protein n=1 Tax=Scleromatobacter humisilvae TaxID=2897159 RepID=A0A9X1YF90_9BURK|nr:cupin domain-containing protein [Scleromatobacter humisilvae]MCK9685289.1 cupin domain-containing protein [Scleromatobacter humisilvae]